MPCAKFTRFLRDSNESISVVQCRMPGRVRPDLVAEGAPFCLKPPPKIGQGETQINAVFRDGFGRQKIEEIEREKLNTKT